MKYLMTAAVAASLMFAGGAEAKSLKGTVVHRNHKAHSFVVANAKGRLASVHATRNPRVGRRVAFKARALRNGTFSAKKLRFHGRSDGALVRGTVTFVDTAARTFTVSDNGASILVHLADTTKTLPATGDLVLVTADLATSTASQLEATDVTINPAADAARPVEIEGVVLSINESTRTLTLSADDDHESGQMIAVTFPSTIDISGYKVGDSVELLATLNPDGQTYTATEIDGDECDHNGNLEDHHGDRQGDNTNEDQGDDNQGDTSQVDDNQGDNSDDQGEDHSGPGGGGSDD